MFSPRRDRARRLQRRRMPECRACSGDRSCGRPGCGRAGTAPGSWSVPWRRGRSAAPNDRGWSGQNAHGGRAQRGGDMHQAGVVGKWQAGPPPSPSCRCASWSRSDLGRAARRRQRFGPPGPFRRGRRPPICRGPFRRKAARPPDNRSSAWRRRPTRVPARWPCRRQARLACRHWSVSAPVTRSCGTGHAGGSGAPSGSASAAFLSMKRGRAFSPRRHRLSSPKRASPMNPIRSGIPARAGARADSRFGAAPAPSGSLALETAPPGAIAWPAPAGCAAGRTPRRRARRAYTRPAGRTARWSGDRPGGSASAVSTPAPPYGRERNRRSTYRERSGSDWCRRGPRPVRDLLNYYSLFGCLADN